MPPSQLPLDFSPTPDDKPIENSIFNDLIHGEVPESAHTLAQEEPPVDEEEVGPDEEDSFYMGRSFPVPDNVPVPASPEPATTKAKENDLSSKTPYSSH